MRAPRQGKEPAAFAGRAKRTADWWRCARFHIGRGRFAWVPQRYAAPIATKRLINLDVKRNGDCS